MVVTGKNLLLPFSKTNNSLSAEGNRQGGYDIDSYPYFNIAIYADDSVIEKMNEYIESIVIEEMGRDVHPILLPSLTYSDNTIKKLASQNSEQWDTHNANLKQLVFPIEVVALAIAEKSKINMKIVRCISRFIEELSDEKKSDNCHCHSIVSNKRNILHELSGNGT